MCKKNRLCTLQVRVSGNYRVLMSCREPDKRTLNTPNKLDHRICFIAAPKSECCRDLIVAAAACVELSACVADLLYQLCLDE